MQHFGFDRDSIHSTAWFWMDVRLFNVRYILCNTWTKNLCKRWSLVKYVKYIAFWHFESVCTISAVNGYQQTHMHTRAHHKRTRTLPVVGIRVLCIISQGKMWWNKSSNRCMSCMNILKARRQKRLRRCVVIAIQIFKYDIILLTRKRVPGNSHFLHVPIFQRFAEIRLLTSS